MRRLSQYQRRLFGDKILDSANLALAGLVFGQWISGTVRREIMLMGLITYLLGWLMAARITKGVKDGD